VDVIWLKVGDLGTDCQEHCLMGRGAPHTNHRVIVNRDCPKTGEKALLLIKNWGGEPLSYKGTLDPDRPPAGIVSS